MKCLCGCGQKVNIGRSYIWGHNGSVVSDKERKRRSEWLKNKNKERIGSSLTKEHKAKLSEAIKGKKKPKGFGEKVSLRLKGVPFSDSHKIKLSISHMGKKLSNRHKKNIGKVVKMRKRTEQHNQKISEALKGKNLSEQHKAKLSKAHKGIVTWNKGIPPKKETREKQSRTMKELWRTSSHCEKMYQAFKLKPNKPELKLQSILNKLFPNEYKYVGDFEFWLGGKNPDFMNVNGKKKLIELFGDYWHRNDNPQDRLDHFKQYGFDTLVIWESELKKIEKLELTLNSFHNKIGTVK